MKQQSCFFFLTSDPPFFPNTNIVTLEQYEIICIPFQQILHKDRCPSRKK